MKKSTISQESGMSLVEITIASGMVIVAALALSQVVYDGTKAVRGVAMNNEFEGLMSNVQQVVSSETVCTEFLRSRLIASTVLGPNLSTAGPFPIDLDEVSFVDPVAGGPPKVVARVTPIAEKGGLIIKRIFLSGLQTNLEPLPDGKQAFIVKLEIEAERLADQKQTVGVKTVRKVFPITVVSDPAAGNNVVNCFQDPRVIDVCIALNGHPDADGHHCDLGPEICRQFGGVYTRGGMPPGDPPCDYSPPIGPSSVPVTPVTPITERVCIEMGGTYTGLAPPSCHFGPNGPKGATSNRQACVAMNGTIAGGRCDFCVANGGVWNASLNGCDFAQMSCLDRARPGFPVIYTPAGQMCDSRAADCDRLHGVIDGDRCRIPINYSVCSMAAGTHSYNIGKVYPSEDDDFGYFDWGCPDGWYVQNLSGHSARWDSDDGDEVDGWGAQVMCCKVVP